MITKPDWKLYSIIAATSLLGTSFLSHGHVNADFEQLSSPPEIRRYIRNNNVGSMVFVVGWLCAWPLSDAVGRKRTIVCSNLCRLLALAIYIAGFVSQEFTKNKTVEPETFVWIAQLCETFYSGLMSLLGPVYVYEILPRKPSAERETICAASGLSLFYGFATFGKLFVYVTLPLEKPAPSRSVYLTGLFIGICTFLQVLLFTKHFPESPSFLAFQRGKPEQAIKVVNMLHNDGTQSPECDYENNGKSASLEFDRIQRDLQVRDYRKRSCYLIMLELLFYIPFGAAIMRGCVAMFDLFGWCDILHHTFFVSSFGYVVAFLKYKGDDEYYSISALKKSLFSSYKTLLILSPFIQFTLVWSNNKIISALVLPLVLAYFLIFCGSSQVITTTLLFKYPRQANRSGNFVCASFLGAILFLFICLCVVEVAVFLYLPLRNSKDFDGTGIGSFIFWLVLIRMYFFVKNSEKKYNATPYEVVGNTENVVNQLPCSCDYI